MTTERGGFVGFLHRILTCTFRYEFLMCCHYIPSCEVIIHFQDVPYAVRGDKLNLSFHVYGTQNYECNFLLPSEPTSANPPPYFSLTALLCKRQWVALGWWWCVGEGCVCHAVQEAADHTSPWTSHLMSVIYIFSPLLMK